MLVPPPARIRFVADSGEVVGHWFLRPARQDGKGEAWKLSFRHPDMPEGMPRRRIDGVGWSNAIVTMIGQAHEVADMKVKHYLECKEQIVLAIQGKLKRRPGFRKSYFNKMLGTLNSEFHKWSTRYGTQMRGHIEWTIGLGWGDPELPIQFPWE